MYSFILFILFVCFSSTIIWWLKVFKTRRRKGRPSGQEWQECRKAACCTRRLERHPCRHWGANSWQKNVKPSKRRGLHLQSIDALSWSVDIRRCRRQSMREYFVVCLHVNLSTISMNGSCCLNLLLWRYLSSLKRSTLLNTRRSFDAWKRLTVSGSSCVRLLQQDSVCIPGKRVTIGNWRRPSKASKGQHRLITSWLYSDLDLQPLVIALSASLHFVCVMTCLVPAYIISTSSLTVFK